MRYFLRRCDFSRVFPGIVAALALCAMAMMPPALAAGDAAEPQPTPPAAAPADPVTPTSPGIAAEDRAKATPKAISKPTSKARAEPAAINSMIDPKSLLGAQLRLGGNLIGKLAGKKAPQANVVVCPASLSMVLSLLDMGASDQMRQAIHRTLGFGGAKETTKDAAKRDLEGTRGIATALLLRTDKEGPLALADIIVFDPASQPLQPAMQKLQAAGAEVSVEDLAKPETIAHINNWVKERTRGLIPTVIEDAPEGAGLVAVNALYFKDRWKMPFDPAGTRDEKFHMMGGNSIDVPMMHAEGRFAFRQDSKFVAVELSYASEGYELVIVTGKEAPLGVNEFAGAAGWLGGQGFEMHEGEVAMPRFSASGTEDLLPTLDALGLGTARRAPGALKGFTATSQTISRVVQKTELRVNEEGTEAAAATAVTTMRSAMASPAQYVKMIVDRPFMFALRDARTGLVLLQGYVARPEAMTEAKAK